MVGPEKKGFKKNQCALDAVSSATQVNKSYKAFAFNFYIFKQR
jgi:hypothetical protein